MVWIMISPIDYLTENGLIFVHYTKKCPLPASFTRCVTCNLLISASWWKAADFHSGWFVTLKDYRNLAFTFDCCCITSFNNLTTYSCSSWTDCYYPRLFALEYELDYLDITLNRLLSRWLYSHIVLFIPGLLWQITSLACLELVRPISVRLLNVCQLAVSYFF